MAVVLPATLTGACVAALGDACYACFATQDEAWAQLRPEFKLDEGLYVGLSAAGNQGPDHKLVQSAVSLGGFSHAMPWMGDVYVSMEAGAQYNVVTKNITPFGALHLGFAY